MKLIALTKIECGAANWFVNVDCIVSLSYNEADEFTWVCVSNGDKFAVKELALDIVVAMTAKVIHID
jgi:hypothetical protein